MQTLELSEDEVLTLSRALEVARDTYRTHRDLCQKTEGHEKVAAQFNRQVIDCETLIHRLEELPDAV